MFKRLFRNNPALEAGRALFTASVEQARRETFYARLGVPDTLDGRFEMVTLHVYLLMRRLKAEDASQLKGARDTSQCLLDAMFQNMDDTLREMGVGDLSVARKIRKLAENFYGRIEAYENAFAANDPSAAIADALSRNVFEREAAAEGAVLAAYVEAAARELAGQPAARIASGIVSFPPPVQDAPEKGAIEQ